MLENGIILHRDLTSAIVLCSRTPLMKRNAALSRAGVQPSDEVLVEAKACVVRGAGNAADACGSKSCMDCGSTLVPDTNVCLDCGHLSCERPPHVTKAQQKVLEERIRIQKLAQAREKVLRAGKAAVVELCGADADRPLPSPLPLLHAVRATQHTAALPPAFADVTRLCRQLVFVNLDTDRHFRRCVTRPFLPPSLRETIPRPSLVLQELHEAVVASLCSHHLA